MFTMERIQNKQLDFKRTEQKITGYRRTANYWCCKKYAISHLSSRQNFSSVSNLTLIDDSKFVPNEMHDVPFFPGDCMG